MFENIKSRKAPIGVELVKKGLITEEQLQEALTYQKRHPEFKIGEVVDILNMCDKKKLISAIAEQIKQKTVDLSKGISINYAEFLPRDVVINNKAIPFEIDGTTVKVAFSDPLDIKAVNEVKLLLVNKGFQMEQYFTLYTMIMEQIREVKNVQDKFVDTSEKDTTILVDNIIHTAIKQRASDIHIEPLEKNVRIRYRIDGELVEVSELPKSRQGIITGRIKSISNMHQEITTDQDGRINSYEDYSIRVSTQKNIHGEKFVLRLLKKESKVRGLKELGYPTDDETIKTAFNKQNGIILLCAPTGEGKTTSLYSILDYLNKPEINVVTIEDPVEIRMEGVNQVEIGHDTSFAGALRTVLRQDPNIILVGEIRDKETAQTAIESGQTGHLVLSTIHTTNSIEAITRIRKMGISDYDISSTFATVISQRLIRRLCEKCKKPHVITEEDKIFIDKVEKLNKVKFDLENATVFQATGCEHCTDLGYYERVGVFENLFINDNLKELIASGRSVIDLKRYAMETTEYKPLVVDAVNKYLKGITTIKEIEKRINI
ncbi:MAG: ATPase, T2SS/T4P/T4SS family [Clostridia bacterium]|nr:ATPase, T2SS/T4P/T4SS family [Clostridia bacterium]MDD4375884.1 ATPase, T2SS/T4P/T4SS family [Clostridia bacterium]